MKLIHVQSLTLILVCYLSTPILNAAKIYKWTDENGQVHFGQKPPIGETNQPGIEAEEIKIRNDQGSPINAQQRGSQWFCGDNSFFTQQDPIADLASLQYKIPQWEQQKLRAWKSIESARKEIREEKINNRTRKNYRSTGYEKQLDWPTKRYNQVRCQLAFGKRKIKELETTGDDFIAEYEKNQKHLKFLTTERNANCSRPSSGWMTGDDYESYKKCAKSYDTTIKKLKKTISSQKYKAKQIYKGKASSAN